MNFDMIYVFSLCSIHIHEQYHIIFQGYSRLSHILYLFSWKKYRLGI